VNRLWVRFALVISAILLAVIFLPLLVGPMLMPGVLGSESDPALAELQRALPPELQAELQARIQATAVTIITRGVILVALVGLLAGIALSRMLLAPLQDLTDGAEAIAAQDLAHRVPVRGSDEMRTVAESFNDMAGQLQQSEGLRRQLLADVSHELRNPLHVLRGNLQAMLDGVYPLDREEVGRLLDQTGHLTALVNDLQELALAEARRLPMDKEAIDTGQLVKEAAEAFRPLAATEPIELRVELLGPPPTVYADPARLRQVLQNLLWNAVRHTPPGGRILLSVENKNGVATITVHDNGAGIAAEHLPRVFDRFYRTDTARDRQSGGSGLGLAIVKATIEAHDGAVSVSSPGPDQGTTFTITLPVHV
jgi:signal transduction histidine kinase